MREGDDFSQLSGSPFGSAISVVFRIDSLPFLQELRDAINAIQVHSDDLGDF